MNRFVEAVSTLENSSIKDWKSRGGRVVGYTCSYVPDEILHAAGLLPFRVRGFSAADTTIGDTYFGPFICSLPKCMLQLAGEGNFNFLDGIIITPGCDSMRRLDECWRKAGDDIEGIMPGFFFHFGVPHKFTDYTLKWFTEETKRLIDALNAHFGADINNDKLSESIKLYNRTRVLLTRFDSLRTRKDPPFTGIEALAVVLAGTALPKEIYNALLEEYITEMNEAPGIAGRSRIMLVGSANDDLELVRIIEGSGGLVAADNLCFGSRLYSDSVDENSDPVEALVTRYLSHNECPRMYGDYKNRLLSLKEKIESANIDGVILQNIRFCDLHGSENGLFERDLEKEGIPCMRLEREYGPLVETGRMKMRVDAFLERLGRRTVAP